MNMLAHALSYAESGFPVFPVHTPEAEGFCSCGKAPCSAIGKHPRTPNGLLAATVDQTQIREWWSLWPEANIGLRPVEGLIVLDVDPPGGIESMKAIKSAIGDLPSTPAVKTGRGGWHLYFLHSKAHAGKVAAISRNGIRPGLDIKSQTGYVLAPPSLHASGNRYAWNTREGIRAPLAVIPDILLDHLLQAKDSPSLTPEREDWRSLIESNALEGTRNETLARVVGTFLSKGISPRDVLEFACFWNRRNCTPPLPEAEVQSVVRSIAKRELAKLRAGRL